MSREIACPSCRKWNDASVKNCIYCDSLLDRNKLHRAERAKKEKEQGITNVNSNPEWMEKLILRAQNSKNPFVKFLIKSAVTLWMIYMAVVGFVLWSVAWLAG